MAPNFFNYIIFSAGAPNGPWLRQHADQVAWHQAGHKRPAIAILEARRAGRPGLAGGEMPCAKMLHVKKPAQTRRLGRL
jgi:hypothetical protein